MGRKGAGATAKFIKNNRGLIEDFCNVRNIKAGTRKGYEIALATFCKWSGKWDLQKVIDRCLKEEDDRVPNRKKWLKKTLMDYRAWLFNPDEHPELTSSNTKTTYYSKFCTFLRHFEITIPDLPPIKYEKEYQVTYFDLPTRDHIRMACEAVDLPLKAIILFMSSSGTAKAETLSLTVKHFLEGCRDYLSCEVSDIKGCLDELAGRRDIVPVIYLRRIKTDKYYYACCSPEASYAIVQMLRTKIASRKLTLDTKLFEFSPSGLLTKFQDINDLFGWGRVGEKYRFFRSHALRKFFASNIGLSAEFVDMFEGRSKNKVHETYIKQNPKKMKELYMSVMQNVMVYNENMNAFEELNIALEETNIFGWRKGDDVDTVDKVHVEKPVKPKREFESNDSFYKEYQGIPEDNEKTDHEDEVVVTETTKAVKPAPKEDVSFKGLFKEDDLQSLESILQLMKAGNVSLKNMTVNLELNVTQSNITAVAAFLDYATGEGAVL